MEALKMKMTNTNVAKINHHHAKTASALIAWAMLRNDTEFVCKYTGVRWKAWHRKTYRSLGTPEVMKVTMLMRHRNSSKTWWNTVRPINCHLHILGCDSIIQPDVWSSTNTNQKCEHLLEFILRSILEIFNIGNIPTFVSPVNWRVSSKPSPSDHYKIPNRGLSWDK